MDDYILNIKTVQSGAFRILIEALKEILTDGNISIDIHNSSEIYKFFQTPRNYRKEIKKIKFNFIYNFDQEITNLNNIEIDNLANPEVNNILGQFISKETILQNRIYFKSLINEAIKSYAG